MVSNKQNYESYRKFREREKEQERILKNIRLFKLKLVNYMDRPYTRSSLPVGDCLCSIVSRSLFLPHWAIIYRPNRHRNRERRSIQILAARVWILFHCSALGRSHAVRSTCLASSSSCISESNGGVHSAVHHQTTKLVTYAKRAVLRRLRAAVVVCHTLCTTTTRSVPTLGDSPRAPSAQSFHRKFVYFFFQCLRVCVCSDSLRAVSRTES